MLWEAPVTFRHVYIALMAGACAACATLPQTGTPSPSPAAGVAAVVGSPATSGAVTVAGLSFAPPSIATMQAIGGHEGIVSTGPSLPFRPTFDAPISQAPKLESGNYELEASFPNPFGDGWGVAGVLAASVSPLGATPLETYLNGTILPTVKAWAADGMLVTNYFYGDTMPPPGPGTSWTPPSHDPKATADEASIVKNAGWPLAYRSDSRHEALFFFEGGQVLSVRWGQQHYTEATVPVSKAQAITTMVAALRDPNAKSEEEKTGRDHFLDVPFAGVFPPNAVNYHDDLVPTFDVPDGIDWNGFLGNDYVDRPAWFINSTWGGGGVVDAVTGDLVRFTRLRVGHGTGGPPSPFMPSP